MMRKTLIPLLRLFGRNWITMFGASLTTVSVVVILGFLFLGLVGLGQSPYIALLVLLVLPAVFVLGLLLIPLGAYRERRKARKAGRPIGEAAVESYPVIDLKSPGIRHAAVGISLLTVLNLLILSTVSYHGVVYMDSSEFCGEVCHTVMQPEYTAYKASPHARVQCVECHIGPGAPWFVRSKLSGLGQVLAITLDTYPRPIPVPVEHLRPSQDTCERCHWPEKFTGDRVKVITRFSDDRESAALKTVLLLHIGGGAASSAGIHSWHISPTRKTVYIASDPTRQQIPWVQVQDATGGVTEYVVEGAGLTAEQIASAEKRTMDCIDCHNRPTHVFQLPAPALDEALEEKRIDARIPFIRKVGVEILTEVGQSTGASEQVAQRLRRYYRENEPEFYISHRRLIENAVGELETIYRSNVFPHMRVTWGTYPNNIGHENFPGCFRCHDGEHKSKDGKTIEQDCTTCHNLLAVEENDPAVISNLGIGQ